jgi:hypothetical protein
VEKTRILVLDNILPYATPGVKSPGDDGSSELGLERAIPGVYGQAAQAPLLANWGGASAMGYFMDVIVSISRLYALLTPHHCKSITNLTTHSCIQMLSLFNGQERTLTQTHDLFRQAGWEIVKLTQSRTVGELLSMVEAKPL